jgi:hypothetical protein
MGRPVVAGGKVARKMRNSRAESLKPARWSFPLCPLSLVGVMTGDETDSCGDGLGLLRGWLVRFIARSSELELGERTGQLGSLPAVE